MPLYEYECPEHGIFDQFNTIANRKKANCPECNKSCRHVIITPPAGKVPNYDWSNENGGRGRRIPQLSAGKQDKSAYYRSRGEAMDAAKRRGLTVEKD